MERKDTVVAMRTSNFPRLPHYLHEAQREGTLVAIERIGDQTFAVTRHRVIEDGLVHIAYVLHRVYSLGDEQIRHDDTLASAGSILLRPRSSANNKRAYVVSSEIDSDLRGKGIGRFLYRTTINDMRERSYTVYSDIARSEEAESLWRGFERYNPEVIKQSPYRYYTAGFVQRRNVKVRKYRRSH